MDTIVYGWKIVESFQICEAAVVFFGTTADGPGYLDFPPCISSSGLSNRTMQHEQRGCYVGSKTSMARVTPPPFWRDLVCLYNRNSRNGSGVWSPMRGWKTSVPLLVTLVRERLFPSPLSQHYLPDRSALSYLSLIKMPVSNMNWNGKVKVEKYFKLCQEHGSLQTRRTIYSPFKLTLNPKTRFGPAREHCRHETDSNSKLVQW